MGKEMRVSGERGERMRERGRGGEDEEWVLGYG